MTDDSSPPRTSSPSAYGRGYRKRRKGECQREALDRQAKYDLYIDGVLLGSDRDTASRFFDSLSPSQQRRVLSDLKFGQLEPTSP